MSTVHAMPREGVTLRFQIAKDQALKDMKDMKIRVTDTFYVVPASARNLIVPAGIDFVAQTITVVDIP